MFEIKAAEPCATGFWKRKCNFNVEKNNNKKNTHKKKQNTWLLSYKCTQETRLRVLQWKILHNIYPTNILLSKMKVKENDKCSYCTDTPDVIEYFCFVFVECPVVWQFWNFIEGNILRECSIKVKLHLIDKILIIKTSLINARNASIFS